MYKNILLTGKSGCGKSTLINEILDSLNINYSGYRTLPYSINGIDKGYYLHGYAEVDNNFSPISIKSGLNSCYSIVETFEQLGVDIIKESINNSKSKIILLDEIGVLESKAEHFISELVKSLDSDKLVLGVIKKKNNEFLKEILNREDTFIVDIEEYDNLDRKLLVNDIISFIKNYV